VVASLLAAVNSKVASPVWLENAAGAVFAWHHPPSGSVREAAVVLCRPFGFEAASSHRAYRHLAQRLAGAGFHVLMIDYHGTGDSSGSDADPDRLSAWLESVRLGAEWTRANLGTTKVVLLGTRFGALMALEAAARANADALVLFAPPASGRVWLREMRALRRLRGGNLRKGFAIPEGGEESAGFLLTGPTIEALSKLDPAAASHPARRVLIIARDDLPGREEHLASKLESHGVEVTLSRKRGYAAMAHDDPRKSVVPEGVWQEITNWLVARYAAAAATPSTPTYSRTAMVREGHQGLLVREEAVDIDGLFGILTEPLETGAAAQAPAVLLLNIGANSHIGSNRMYVNLARRWALLGFRVLRFDSVGLGDSPANDPAAENRVYSEGAIDDSRRAMDFLALCRGTQRFVLMGLCSGAYVSYRAALSDPRVTGIALINILLFHWKEGDPIDVRKRDAVNSTHFYRQAAFRSESWRRLLRGELNLRTIAPGLLQKAWVRGRLVVKHALVGESDVAANFRAMMRRGVEVLLVFSHEDGGRDEVDMHLGTDGAQFRGNQRFRLEVIDDTDHTFSPLWSHEVLFSLLTKHLLGRFTKIESRSH
jgi:alpha-beta hydrolase superfamily lysophospholipase